MNRVWLSILSALLLVACRAAETPVPSATSTPGPAFAPTATPPLLVSCADLDAYWGNDWPAVLDVLEQLIAAGQSCGDEPLLSKQYAVHFNYAASLEGQADLEAAIEQYRAALIIDPRRREALGALVRLTALPKATPPTCLSAASPRPDPAPADAPDPARFVQVEQGRLVLAGRPFRVRGLNYYPRHAAWERFWSEAEAEAMAAELDVVQAAGFNTLRLFLWYEPLFTCHPEEAIPNEAAFALFDTLLALAGERNLKLIVSLHDLPDLLYRPLYTDWARYDAQTTYIVRRYRNEPSLLAWDVRNAPDFDLAETPGRFSEADVTAWLEHITSLIREHDPHHLLTAGFDRDPGPAAQYVDISGIQHWEENEALAERLAVYRVEHDQPLLLMAAGEHSWPKAPESPQDEASQAGYLEEIVALAEANDVGWLLWTAFDFVPPPGQPDHYNYHFGLWRTDLQPKLVLETLPLDQP